MYSVTESEFKFQNKITQPLTGCGNIKFHFLSDYYITLCNSMELCSTRVPYNNNWLDMYSESRELQYIPMEVQSFLCP